MPAWDPEIEAAWVDEAHRRWKELKTGTSDAVPWVDVKASLFRTLEDTPGR